MSNREKRKRPEKEESSAIKALKQARSGEVKPIDAVIQKKEIFEELDEEEYERKKRRNQQFVVDDDGLGYDDYGEEDLNDAGDEDEMFEDFEEAEVDGQRKPTKRARPAKSGAAKPAEKKKPDPVPNQRLAALMKGSTVASKPAAARKEIAPPLKPKASGSDDLDSMLDDLISNPKDNKKPTPTPLAKLPATSAITAYAKPVSSTSTPTAVASSPPKSQPKIAAVTTAAPVPTTKPDASLSTLSDLPDSFFDDIDIDQAEGQSQPRNTQTASKGTSHSAVASNKKIELQQRTEDNQNDWWSLGQGSVAVVEETPAASDVALSTGEDLAFYWFDAHEDMHNPGTVYLFGKIYSEKEAKHVSCCVAVKNLMRCCFIAPRPYILDEKGEETSAVPTSADINKELEPIRQKMNIKKWLSKTVTRTYSFDGHPDVPRTPSEFVKAKYPATAACFDTELSGRTFSHIFGSHASLLELLLLKRKIMGPCWLSIKNPTIVPSPVTWTRHQVNVDDMTNLSVMKDQPVTPTLSVLSLKIITTLEEPSRTNEIVMVSGIFHSDVNVDGPTEDLHKKYSHFTALRNLKTGPLPHNFNQATKKSPGIQICNNERSLLACVLGKIHSLDPDVVVGHNFIGFDLDVLLHRMETQKIPNWSKLGRLKTAKMPKYLAAREAVMTGRLVCDTYAASKDIIREKNYRLSDLARSQLGIERKEIEPEEIPAYFDKTESLLYLVKYTENDCFLALSLMFKLMILPLTKQLTNIAGNLWGHSLQGRRAERIEYLLLHEFHSKKYIVPDKETFKEKMDKKEAAKEKAKGKGKKKPAYAGGLVLAPLQGLYDKFILLLDFNSLYPSIIQEHNICFTTISRQKNSDGTWEEASPPTTNTEQGLLPKVIRMLVDRRRGVKNVMKGETNPTKLQQLDTRQQALKLIANSMYGCLGFTNSRFYAMPLAELVTRKGRETLQQAVDLAKSHNLQVIYGDTDSIMIHTGLSDLNEAKKIGNALKKDINKMFKLLEIEIDGIFKSMLLLKKKKYAALTVHEKSDGTVTFVRQAKGLDLVRRDWCDLSKVMGNTILDYILSDKPREEIVSSIHEYLRSGLAKDPEEYADAKSQPHVQVALRRRKQGKSVRSVVSYVICEGTSQSYAERAYAPEEVEKSDGTLKVDLQWYLTQQIIPPVSRLCENIEGTDVPQLASCLGLDPSKFKVATTTSSNDNDSAYFAPSSEMDAEERYKNVDKFLVNCKLCGTKDAFPGIFRDYAKMKSGLSCKSCEEAYTSGSLQNQLDLAVRGSMQKFYEGWLECDEHSCKNRTRQPHTYKSHSRCIVPGCKGVQRAEYTPEQLYNQLQYFQYLFDVEKFQVKPGMKAHDRTAKEILSSQELNTFNSMNKKAGGYLNLSVLHHVSLAQWFSYYNVISSTVPSVKK